MITFILIFFTMLIVVSVSAIVGFSFYLKRRAKKLTAQDQKRFVGEPPPRHSLFEADETHSKQTNPPNKKSNF